MFWIALHLPSLSLETFAATLPASAPIPAVDWAASGAGEPVADAVLLALIDAQHRIVAADAPAQALGVRPGMKRATALALAPRLQLGQVDAARDAQALQAVAHAALAFTPQVSLQPASSDADVPHCVLMEVQASLRYFGGLVALRNRLLAVLAPLGHGLHCVAAPTPQGAALLARLHRHHHCADLAALQQALDAAPLWLIGPGREHWDALQGMGLRSLSDLRRLPRAGLARRFGAGLLDELDRAYGTRPDPRQPITLPAAFDSRLELFARADTTEQVLHGAGRLLAQLVTWLAAQHAQLRRFRLVMRHEPRWRRDDATPPATTLDIALAEPSRDAAHLQVLLRERLATLQLPAPTLELQLQADDIVRRAPPNSELFPTAGSEREGLTRLIERLQARLGAEQVQRLVLLADHRPERASALRQVPAGDVVVAPVSGAVPPAASRARPAKAGRRKPPASAAVTLPAGPADAPVAAPATPAAPAALAVASAPSSPAPATPRPVWLLQRPEPLPERRSRPVLDGRPLQLLSGPERIESGWWDDALAERDYFIAQQADGALVWLYRARLPASEGDAPGWFLHGRFG